MSAGLPTVGRVVHYYAAPHDDAPGPGPFAADIVAVVVDMPTGAETHVVELLVKYPRPVHNIEYLYHVPFSETPLAGCWTWPPRV